MCVHRTCKQLFELEKSGDSMNEEMTRRETKEDAQRIDMWGFVCLHYTKV